MPLMFSCQAQVDKKKKKNYSSGKSRGGGERKINRIIFLTASLSGGSILIITNWMLFTNF